MWHKTGQSAGHAYMTKPRVPTTGRRIKSMSLILYLCPLKCLWAGGYDFLEGLGRKGVSCVSEQCWPIEILCEPHT